MFKQLVTKTYEQVNNSKSPQCSVKNKLKIVDSEDNE